MPVRRRRESEGRDRQVFPSFSYSSYNRCEPSHVLCPHNTKTLTSLGTHGLIPSVSQMCEVRQRTRDGEGPLYTPSFPSLVSYVCSSTHPPFLAVLLPKRRLARVARLAPRARSMPSPAARARRASWTSSYDMGVLCSLRRRISRFLINFGARIIHQQQPSDEGGWRYWSR